MYRFLTSPRWIAGIVLVLLAAATMVRLGFWQLDRMHQKQDRNAAVSANLDATPKPAAEIIPPSPDQRPAAGDDWTKVSITGSYDESQTILIRQRSFEEGVGYEIVVPFVADDGRTYLVDRGYVVATAGAEVAPDVPPAPSGTVTVTGNVRVPYDASASATRVEYVGDYRSVRALDPPVLSEALGTELAGGYLTVTDEAPADGSAVAAISRIPVPELDDGPHLSYAVQWWLFALLTLGGFGYIVRREAIDRLLAEEDLDDGDVIEDDDVPAASGV